MMQQETPIFGGLLPTQVACLSMPINMESVRVHPYRGWPYVPGVTIRNTLNMVFGFGGWDYQITDISEERIAADGSGGKFRVMFSCIVRLRIYTPGGRVLEIDGTGSDEKTSKNLIDCYQNGRASAVTYALRDAAINLGQQFGLAVMRLHAKDADGNDVDWRRFAARRDPQWPDWPALSGQVPTVDGQAYDAQTGVVDSPAPAPGPRPPAPRHQAPAQALVAGHQPPTQAPPTPPAEQPPVSVQLPSQGHPEPPVPGPTPPVPGSTPGKPPAQAAGAPAGQQKWTEPRTLRPTEPAPVQPSTVPPSTPLSASTSQADVALAIVRREQIDSLRAAWRVIGKNEGQLIFDEAKAHCGMPNLLPVAVIKPVAEGGPTTEFLNACLAAMYAQARKMGR